MKKNIKYIITFLFLFVILNLFSQDDINSPKNKENVAKGDLIVRTDQIISKDFPRLETYVSVVNKKDNSPMLSLVKGNFKAFLDGVEVKSMDVLGFQYTEEPIAYSVLLSSNGMMEGGPIELQQKAVVNIMESLRDQDTLSLYLFGEEVKPVFESVKKDGTLLEKISKVELLGFNPHLYDSLIYVARRFEESKIKRKVIIVMSDGREVGSKYTEEQMYGIIDRLNIPVYSIGIRMMAGQNLYRVVGISEHTGGGYIYTPEIYNIPDSMSQAITQIKMGYYLKIKTSKLNGDDQFHQLEIRVNSKEGEASFFKNFIATKIPMPLWVKILILVCILIIIVILVLLFLIIRREQRKRMGITKRKCPVCKRRMKDDWDECVFCKYLPKKQKKKKEEYK